jgi:hypothetical protein
LLEDKCLKWFEILVPCLFSYVSVLIIKFCFFSFVFVATAIYISAILHFINAIAFNDRARSDLNYEISAKHVTEVAPRAPTIDL